MSFSSLTSSSSSGTTRDKVEYHHHVFKLDEKQQNQNQKEDNEEVADDDVLAKSLYDSQSSISTETTAASSIVSYDDDDSTMSSNNIFDHSEFEKSNNNDEEKKTEKKKKKKSNTNIEVINQQKPEDQQLDRNKTTSRVVHFKRSVKVRLMKTCYDYTRKEMESKWWTEDEYHEMNERRYNSVSYRAEMQRKQYVRSLAYDTVLDAQDDNQKEMSIASLYKNVCSGSILWARTVGMKNQREAELCYDTDIDQVVARCA